MYVSALHVREEREKEDRSASPAHVAGMQMRKLRNFFKKFRPLVMTNAMQSLNCMIWWKG